MLFAFGALVAVAINAVTVLAQSASPWTDPITGATFQRFTDTASDSSWAYLFPSTPNGEFIGVFTAPATAGWYGASLGGGMRSNPLVVAWLDSANQPVISVRYTTQYSLPTLMEDPPIVTVLGSSGVNGTHQRVVYRCQNCGTWTGGTGGINFNGNHIFGYAAHNSLKPVVPSNPGSSLTRHTVAAQHGVDTVAGRSTSYSAHLERYIAAPPFGSAPQPPSTTIPPPSTTIPPPSTTVPPPSTTVPPPTTTGPPPPTGSTVPLWGQCGGQGYTGPTQCAGNAICFVYNAWHHQCIPR